MLEHSLAVLPGRDMRRHGDVRGSGPWRLKALKPKLRLGDRAEIMWGANQFPPLLVSPSANILSSLAYLHSYSIQGTASIFSYMLLLLMI